MINRKNEELIRRIPDQEWEVITKRQAQLQDIEGHIKHLTECLKQGSWGDVSKNDPTLNPDMPDYAMIAVRNGIITPHQFGSLLLYWSAQQHHKDHQCPFQPLVCQVSNPEDFALIAQTFISKDEQDTNLGLNEVERERWGVEVKKLSIDQQQFFVIPYLEKHPKNSIVNVLQKIDFSAFGVIKSKQMEIIPSVGMIQAYYNVKYGVNAVKINVVIGPSSDLDLCHNGIKGDRDFACHFPGVSLGIEADFHYAPWFRFSIHDGFHGAAASRINASVRMAIAQVAGDDTDGIAGAFR